MRVASLFPSVKNLITIPITIPKDRSHLRAGDVASSIKAKHWLLN